VSIVLSLILFENSHNALYSRTEGVVALVIVLAIFLTLGDCHYLDDLEVVELCDALP